MTRFIIILYTLFFSFTCYAQATGTAEQNTFAFLSLSDIHFDPFIVCKVQKIKPCPLIQKLNAASATEWPAILKQYDTIAPASYRDTGYMLLTAMLASAKQAANEDHAQFVLVLGDFLGHEYRQYYRIYTKDASRAHYQEFVKKTLTFLLGQLRDTFPGLDVYIISGNNDGYRHDYFVETNSAFFQDLSAMSAKLIVNPQHRAELEKTFPRAGYYAVELNTRLRLLMLNSVLFSYKVNGVQVARAANQELDWLHQQLTLAKQKQQRVLMAMHIPEGKDFYLLSSIKLLRLLDLWRADYTKIFNAEVAEFAPEIAGILTGHLHWDSLHTLKINGAEVDAVGVPAISPIFGTRPAFTTLFYSLPDYQLEDRETFTYSFGGA